MFVVLSICLQLPIVVPITFVLICAFLVIVPCYVAPYEVGMGLLITLIGIPVYYIGVAWRSKPQWFQSVIRDVTMICQKLFMTAKEEQD